MAEKTLGEIARETWLLVDNNPIDWQAVADEVILEYEARRWRGIDSAPKDGWFWINTRVWGPRLGRNSDDHAYDFEFFEPNFAGHKTHHLNAVNRDEVIAWTPVPAPPKEVEHAE